FKVRSRRPPKISSRFTGSIPFGGDVSKRQPGAKHRTTDCSTSTHWRSRCSKHRKAVEMLRMKESYGEGLASHTGSESCGHGRKAGYEALTGETTGQVIEPRNTPNFRTPTP